MATEDTQTSEPLKLSARRARVVQDVHRWGEIMNGNNGNFCDAGTGALLSGFFEYVVDWEIKRSLRYQNFATLLVLEPDRKPRYSETLGTLVSLIRKNLRDTDIVGRLNDGKFGVLLLHADLDGAYITASRIVEHINNYIFSEEKGQHLTVSIGAACFPTNSTSVDKGDLFKEAEGAFRLARKAGNSIYFPGLPILENSGGIER